MIPTKTLAQWRALCEAATSGEWSVTETPGFGHDHAPYTVVDEHDEQVAECYDNTPGKRSLEENAANAAFIAAARSAMPALLAEVERLREENESMASQSIADHIEYKNRRNQQFAAYELAHRATIAFLLDRAEQ